MTDNMENNSYSMGGNTAAQTDFVALQLPDNSSSTENMTTSETTTTIIAQPMSGEHKSELPREIASELDGKIQGLDESTKKLNTLAETTEIMQTSQPVQTVQTTVTTESSKSAGSAYTAQSTGAVASTDNTSTVPFYNSTAFQFFGVMISLIQIFALFAMPVYNINILGFSVSSASPTIFKTSYSALGVLLLAESTIIALASIQSISDKLIASNNRKTALLICYIVGVATGGYVSHSVFSIISTYGSLAASLMGAALWAIIICTFGYFVLFVGILFAKK